MGKSKHKRGKYSKRFEECGMLPRTGPPEPWKGVGSMSGGSAKCCHNLDRLSDVHCELHYLLVHLSPQDVIPFVFMQ